MNITQQIYDAYGIRVTDFITAPCALIDDRAYCAVTYNMDAKAVEELKTAEAIYVVNNKEHMPLKDNKLRCIALIKDNEGMASQIPTRIIIAGYYDKVTSKVIKYDKPRIEIL